MKLVSPMLTIALALIISFNPIAAISFGSIGGDIESGFSDPANWLKDHIGEPIEGIISQTEGDISNIQSQIAKLAQEGASFEQTMQLNIQSGIKSAFLNVANQVKGDIDTIKNETVSIGDDIKKTTVSLESKVQGVGAKIGSGLEDAGKSIEHFTVHSFDKVKDFAVSSWGKVDGLINKVIMYVEILLGKYHPSCSDLRDAYAKSIIKNVAPEFTKPAPASWPLSNNDYYQFLLYNIFGCMFDELGKCFSYDQLNSEIISKLGANVTLSSDAVAAMTSNLSAKTRDQICLNCDGKPPQLPSDCDETNSKNDTNCPCTTNCNKTLSAYYCNQITANAYLKALFGAVTQIAQDPNYAIYAYNVIAQLIPTLKSGGVAWSDLQSALGNIGAAFSNDSTDPTTQIPSIQAALKSGTAMTALPTQLTGQYVNDPNLNAYVFNTLGQLIPLTTFSYEQLANAAQSVGVTLTSDQQTALQSAITNKQAADAIQPPNLSVLTNTKDQNYVVYMYNTIGAFIPTIYKLLTWDQINTALKPIFALGVSFTPTQISAIKAALQSGKSMPQLKPDLSGIYRTQISQQVLSSLAPYKGQDLYEYIFVQTILSFLQPGSTLPITQYFTWAQLMSDIITPSDADLTADDLQSLKQAYDTAAKSDTSSSN